MLWLPTLSCFPKGSCSCSGKVVNGSRDCAGALGSGSRARREAVDAASGEGGAFGREERACGHVVKAR